MESQSATRRDEFDRNAQSRIREDGTRRNAAPSTNNGRPRGGGNKSWRGGGPGGNGQRPRTRTESWPAVRNDQSNFQLPPPGPIAVETPGIRVGPQNWRGRGGGHSSDRFARTLEFTPPTSMSTGFSSFSYGGPPPPLMEPRFYFEAEYGNGWGPFLNRPHPPHVYALNPMCPRVVRPMHQQQQQRAPRGNDVRFLEKPFSNLRLNRTVEDGEKNLFANQKRTIDDGTKKMDGNDSGKKPKLEKPTVPSLMASRELGLINSTKLKRQVAEIRLRQGGTTSGTASTIKKILEDFPGESLERCQFMEATPDGKNIFGSWALRDRDWTRIMCARVDTDRRKVDEGRYGIGLTPSDNYIYVMDKNVVDMCRARVDNMVTCVLYVTAPSETPGSRIFLQPVPELSETNDQSRMTTPIYNAHWSINEDVLSCAWDFTKMRLSVGLERYGMIVDVVSETDFKLFSCHKNVLVQRFSKDGSLLYMGVRDSSILCCDLRRQFHHAVYALPQSSACWLHLMSDENYLIAADFSGQIKLWDLRTQRIVRTFDGQSNSRTKLPVVVDEQDSLIFAVGDNGTTSGWSLKTGQLLRQIPCPYTVTDGRSLPRVCYSGCWAGVQGNAAVVLGCGDEAHFYELQL